MIDWPIATLMPHAGDVILLDHVDSFDAMSIVATCTVPSAGPFCLPQGGLPPWLGLEIMAQAMAAWAGCQAHAKGDRVVPGFLLGTRRYTCEVARFAAGDVLTVHASRTLQDDAGMAIFDSRIERESHTIAQARLTVFQPDNPDAFLTDSLAS